MKAVILAAGMGTRIRPLTDDKPKTFLEIENVPLIIRSLDNLNAVGIREVIIVVGYMQDYFIKRLGTSYKNLKISYIINKEYSKTGSMYSLSQTKGKISDNILLLESDLVYEKRALVSLIDSPEPNEILVASLSGSGDEVYICVNEKNELINLGKKIAEKYKAIGELVGISKLSLDFLNKLYDKADQDYKREEKNFHYEEVIFALSKTHPIKCKLLKDLTWIEIDNITDYNRAKEKIYPKIKEKEMARGDFFIKRNILLNPGPATTTDSVKYALVVPDICPREKEFGNLMEGIRKDLVKIAYGDENYTAILLAGSGTAAMDSTISSVVPYNKKILILINGAYGVRFSQIAKTYNIDVVELKFEIGKKIQLQQVEVVLKQDKEIACVAVIHHETTVGILNPIKEIGKIVKKYNKTFIVDTISSFAGVPINIKECNIDFMMSTSNKCIQGMAGVVFVICNKESLLKLKSIKPRSFYLDLYGQYEYLEKEHQTRFTPPVQILYALKKAINEFFEEGAENRFNRYKENYNLLKEGLKKLGFKFLMGEDVEESNILTTIYYLNDPNFSFDVLHDKLYERGFTIYPGKISEKNTFRIAVMGAIFPEDIKKFIIILEEVLIDMKIKI